MMAQITDNGIIHDTALNTKTGGDWSEYHVALQSALNPTPVNAELIIATR